MPAKALEVMALGPLASPFFPFILFGANPVGWALKLLFWSVPIYLVIIAIS